METLGLIGDIGLNVVDEKEIARCRQLFTFYDEDKDGKLTYAELLTCVRCCGRNPSIDEFKELVTVIDTTLVRFMPSTATCNAFIPRRPGRQHLTCAILLAGRGAGL